jgi:Ca2+-binding RTX toxin-like protein
MNRSLKRLRNRPRPIAVRRRVNPPRLKVLEDRTVPSGTPVVFSSLQDFLVEDTSQFGPGGALVYEKEGFLGVAFDTGNHTIGGVKEVTLDLPWPFRDLDLGTYGAKATVGLRGKLGFDYGLAINTGSADVSYSTEVSHRFDDPNAVGDVLLDTDVAVLDGSLATHWPEVQAFLNLVLDVEATAKLEAWFVESLGMIGGDNLSIIDVNKELFFLDTAGEGSDVRVLGESVSGEIIDISVPIPVPIPGVDVSLDAELALESDPLRLVGSNAVSVGVTGDIVKASIPMGESSLTLAPAINLETTTPDADGKLVAESVHDDYSQLASLSWELGKLVGPLGPREFSLLDFATLKITPVSFLAGPRLYAGQKATVTPSSMLTYKFDRPVPVQTGSAASPFVTVTEVTFAPGDYVNIHFDGEPIVVTPELRFGMDLNNRFTLDPTLGGTLTVGEIALEVDFGSSTVANWAEDLLDEYLGFHRDGDAVVISAGPLFAKDFDLELPISLPVFNDTFNILTEVRTLPSFTIGQAVADPPLLSVENASGDENAPIPLTIVASLVDTDGSETLSITVAGVSAGAVLNHGTNQGGGVWVLAPEDLAGLTLVAPDNTSLSLSVTATATEASNGASASTAATLEVTVNNVAPMLTISGSEAVYEGMLYTLNLAASDPGDDTIGWWTIDWGDRSAVQVVPGNPPAVTHTYADGDAARTINVTATDEDGTFEAEPLPITVNNVAPTVGFTGSRLNLDEYGQPIPFSGVRGQTLNFAGTISDRGFDNETFTYVIAWGDGTSTGTLPADITGVGAIGVPTTGAFAATHVYASEGPYEVKVTVKDDDGTTIVTKTVTIAVIALQEGGDLAVGGTPGNDSIQFSPAGSVEARLNGASLGVFNPTGRLLGFGQAGDDQIQASGSIALSAWFDGGAGHDTIKGGAGDDVLLGGPGDDLLIGQSGRDLLIGGGGADRLVGNADDDILIAGFTDFDADLVALAAIQAEWTSEHDLATRLANLSGRTEAEGNPGYADRLNDVYFLKLGETVWDDDEKDLLTGAAGDDWFFLDSDLDKATDLKGKRSRAIWRSF